MKPRVNTRCVADRYAAPNERIIEFSSDCGGGLISLAEHDGRLHVNVYNYDPTVVPIVSYPHTTFYREGLEEYQKEGS